MTESISSPAGQQVAEGQAPSVEELKLDIAALEDIHKVWAVLVGRDHNVCVHLRGAMREMEQAIALVGKVSK